MLIIIWAFSKWESFFLVEYLTSILVVAEGWVAVATSWNKTTMEIATSFDCLFNKHFSVIDDAVWQHFTNSRTSFTTEINPLQSDFIS